MGTVCNYHGSKFVFPCSRTDIHQFLQLLKEPPPPVRVVHDNQRPFHTRNISTPSHLYRLTGERQPLVRRRSFDEYENRLDEEIIPGKPLAGGTILGIHNLAIVLPQLMVRTFYIMASLFE